MSDRPMPEVERRCCVCQRAEDHTLNERRKYTVELRPYGPGGADICVECAFATPEQQEQTKQAFSAMLQASEAASPLGTAVIGHGHDRGPDPLVIPTEHSDDTKGPADA